MRRVLPAAVVLAGAATLTACQLPINTSGFAPNGGPELEGETLTNYGAVPGTYQYSGAGNAVSIAAPANIDNDEREAFWYDGTPMAQDEESCAQWSSAPGLTQQGAMLHMTRTVAGGLRGISVMQNVWGWSQWYFNVLAWDTDSSQPFTLLGRSDLSSVVMSGNDYAARPWWMCARTVGDQLQFVVWTGNNPRPAYGTPGAGGEFTIPSDYQQPGMAGWYIGHIPAGSSAQFNNLTTSDNDVPATTAAGLATEPPSTTTPAALPPPLPPPPSTTTTSTTSVPPAAHAGLGGRARSLQPSGASRRRPTQAMDRASPTGRRAVRPHRRRTTSARVVSHPPAHPVRTGVDPVASRPSH
jgi:hypothetical protein